MIIPAGYKFMPYASYLASTSQLASGVTKFAAVYSGTPPTQAQILAATDSSSGNIKWDVLRTALADRKLLAYVNTTKPLFAVRDGIDLVRIPLAALDTPATVVASGTPTWYIFGHVATGAITSPDTPDTASGIQLGNMITGTVGNENSAADIQIMGGNIAVENGYTFMDLTLRF